MTNTSTPAEVILLLLECLLAATQGAAAGEMVEKNKSRTVMITAADASRAIE